MDDLVRVRRTILAGVAVLVLCCLWVPAAVLARDPDNWLGMVGLGVLVAGHAAVLRFVTEPPAPRWALWVLLAATAVSILLVAPVGPADRYTWAWIGGATAGILPFLITGRSRWPAAVGAVGLAVAVGAVTGGSPVVHGVIAASVGAAVVGGTVVPLWLWTLLLDARAGREARARLAVTEERLRFARDLHDLLGHRLTVIALKSELAERLAAADPDRAARESAQARHLAATALAEVREAVAGYREVDLADQVAAAAGVLRDAGVRCATTVAPVPSEVAARLAFVVREACTNILRHSAAAWCTIDITSDGEGIGMRIVNDGVSGTGPDRHAFGLRGMTDRVAEVGGTLRVERDGDVFALDVAVPVP
ncbi:hypothetical protein GCM10022243_39420 [Saccharothrix violaceirubra]|uniref:Two-component system sensor histidine kinase DesK n=1 Tax=Saccharothrix violaceirubra TaxID=413306 RepID=A0A7W7T0F2_9PSEU|nr:histidine kinase [Saccharothrix violaceirubra]MBB4964274.1 two-component system sensor histidine kinase DesK [Saccharothrix violaceirubra]